MISVDMNRLLQFVKVVKAGNISRAAESLGVPKSILSRNLALLEREVGQQLVYRTTRQFHLTESGHVLFEAAQQGLGSIERSLEDLHISEKEISGTIRITAPDDVGVLVLMRIIDEFSKMYPKIHFEIIYTNETLDLVAEGIDVAVRVGVLKNSSLKRRHAGRVELILVAAPSLLNLQGKAIALEHLTNIPAVGFSKKGRNLLWSLQSGTQKVQMKMKASMIANNYLAVCDLVVRGHGVGFVPRFLCEPYLKSGELIHILKSWRNDGVPIQIVLPGQKETQKRIKIFSDFCAKKLAETF